MAFAAVLDVAGALSAQGAGSGRVPLRGHQALVPPGATLIGPAPSTTTLPLAITLQPRNPAALAAEVRAVSDPASPEYRHFLTPVEFAQRYGPTPGTIAKVTAVLRNEGLAVGTPSATGLSLPVSGTVAEVQSAFSTPIARYRLASGKTGYDNGAAPEVPVSVAPQIEGVLGLDTLSPPRPTTTLPQASSLTPHAGSPAASPALAPYQPTPQPSCATAISAVQGGTGALDADQLAQAYSFDPLYSSNHYGAGTTVALLEMSGAGYLQSDIDTFAACYGIGDGQVTQVDMNGGGGTGPATAEAELDIETVLSLAPKANIEVYEGGASDDMYTIFSRIVSDDTAKIVSVSWTNGCEAYVAPAYQNSENTILQAAATEGQSFFVASGDQGSQGCNLNGEISAPTGSGPMAQAVDPSTGTLYVANKSDGTLNVDGEGGTNVSNAVQASKPFTGVSPDAVAVDASVGKVFVANAGSNTLTVFSTATCNKTTTTGCGSPAQITSVGGQLSAPKSLAANGSTLYVGNGNGTVAVYNAATNTWKAAVTLPSSSVPSALAVDATNGYVYVADSANGRVEYFSTANCNASSFSGCGATPTTVAVGNGPVGLAVAGSAGDLYVANAGSGGGISVVSLSTHALVTTISTSQPSNGTGLVQSIGLSPDGHEVLAALSGLGWPGDVMATVNTSTQTVSATVNLEIGTDSMGQVVSDPTLGYAWVTDQTGDADVVQNLNLAVSDPASQPNVTAVGGTSFGHQTPTIGPPPSESVWNDQLYFSEGAGGGGISKSFTMPAYQQPLGTVSGSSGTPCANAGGDCREVPDVSADADPSTGYIVYDTVYGFGGWNALGGTSGAAPLWAGVLAVAASADGNTAGYGAVNPALYLLAQKSPGTYFNDITSGNNDYNATNGGSFPAMSGYDMATGLGTPVTSQLAAGLTGIPLAVAVSGTQTYGGSPTFTASANYAGSGTTPFGVTLSTSGLTCTTVGVSTTIGPTLTAGPYTLAAASCGGLMLTGPDAADYSVVYTSAANDFTVTPAPLTVTASSGSMSYGGTVPTITAGFAGFKNGDTASSLTSPPTCSTTATSSSPVATYPSSCSGAADSNYAIGYVGGSVTVSPVPLTITAASPSMVYGGTVPAITPNFSGFKNGDTASSLTTPPTCSTTATSSSPVATYPSSCSGAADSNYTIGYVTGTVTVTKAPLTITASNVAMTYGGTVPSVVAGYSGFVNGDGPGKLTTAPTCSTTATSSSPASPPTYPSTCNGAVDPNYAIVYVAGLVTVNPAPLTITAGSPSMTYGGTVPAITPLYTGFVDSDTGSSLTPPPTCTTTATSSSPASPPTYPSSCSGASDPNYTITYAGGAVAVNPAPLTISASSGSMVYGGSVPGIIPNYSGFVNGDSASSLTSLPACSTTATSSSPASPPTYPSSCSGAGDPNYAISYVAGTVTVAKAPLTITASSGAMTYGGAVPTITPAYTGFVNGDGPGKLTTAPSCSTTATSSSPVAGSPYASSCSGAVDPNYAISYAGGSVTVAKAPLTITASSPTGTYGSPSPAVAPLYTGFVNGETASSLTTKPTCSTTATSSSPASPPTYPSSCSGAADPNYSITYAGGAVTVSQAPLTITASSPPMTYGSSPPAITAQYTGFVNGDSASTLTTPPTCTTAATSSSPASPPTYPSTCGGAADPNYAIGYAAGAVTVNKAPLTVTASSGSMTYGGARPAITPSFTGFVNGDSSSSLTSQPTCTTAATSSSPASPPTYPSTCSGAADGNYAISYAAGAVTVNKAPLTVTASSPSVAYGSVPAVAPIYTGFVNGDASSSLTSPPTCTTTATSSSPASPPTYPSSCSGAVDPNYTIGYVAGTVTVTKAPLTITASSGAMTYGGTVPTITAIFSGFKNGDTASTLTTPPTCSTTATGTSGVAGSPYGSSCSGAAADNYAIGYVPGTVTVTPAPIAVAVSGSQSNGGAPTFTGTETPPPPPGVSVNGTLTCSQVNPSTTISSQLPSGTYTLVASSCGGLAPGGADAGDYAVAYSGSPGDFAVTGGPSTSSTPPPPDPAHGYWLVGSDGGIFTFGSASFYGSTGSLTLQRPVVGITPTEDRAGYWLVASDGGTFAFGDAGFYGSIPGLGLHPAGSGLPHSLNAPIVGMVPAADGQGYFVVASDGGVFAFGPGASFAGSCPGIGGCSGPAVSVIPDATGNGYWLFTATGNVYTFGDAPFLGSPGTVGSPVTSAVRTPDGKGYLVLVANGTVYAYGDAAKDGSPGGQFGGVDPATAVFATSDGNGYWVVGAVGAVEPYGDAPNDGGMAGTRLNGAIIAATGF